MGSCLWCCIVLAIAIATAAFFGNNLLNSDPERPSHVADGWWGRGKPTTAEDTSIKKFTINVTEDVLRDLNNRLGNSRLGEDLQDTTFNYGFQVNYMKEVLQYWKTKYDWREQEKKINQFDHYRTNIEGIDVHFMRKTSTTSTKAAKPIMLVHGWPGSVWEFHKMIPMLTDPTKHGGLEDDAFDVICPSIPGYGFSEAPHRQGFGAMDAARVFVKLMRRLGIEEFYYQGGDWGGLIGNMMARAYPQHILGMHLNMFRPTQLSYNMKLLAGSLFPSLVGLTQAEAARAYPLSRVLTDLLSRTGYLHLQATKPDTIAFSLTDSPVGLAAYILEKFSAWTNPANTDLKDGGLTRKFSMDDLLTNVMIYWITGSIGPSMRFYKENFGRSSPWAQVPIWVPTGLVQHEHELIYVPEVLAKIQYRDIVQYTYIPDGGHFAALENAERLTSDVRSFVRKVSNRGAMH